MARIPISGANDEAIAAVATDVREVISGLNIDGDGRVFYLTHLSVHNSHASATGTLALYDSDEDTGVTATTQRYAAEIPPGDFAHDFPAPGLKFITNIVAAVSAGTIAADGGIRASGYLV